MTDVCRLILLRVPGVGGLFLTVRIEKEGEEITRLDIERVQDYLRMAGEDASIPSEVQP